MRVHWNYQENNALHALAGGSISSYFQLHDFKHKPGQSSEKKAGRETKAPVALIMEAQFTWLLTKSSRYVAYNLTSSFVFSQVQCGVFLVTKSCMSLILKLQSCFFLALIGGIAVFSRTSVWASLMKASLISANSGQKPPRVPLSRTAYTFIFLQWTSE